MENKYCQCCAMPLDYRNEMNGTNSDGTKNEDYCKYCYMDGTFTSNISMKAKIELCVPHMVSANSGMSEDEARRIMKEFFPTLKRWRKN